MIKLETLDVANSYTSLVDTVLSWRCAYKCVCVCLCVCRAVAGGVCGGHLDFATAEHISKLEKAIFFTFV